MKYKVSYGEAGVYLLIFHGDNFVLFYSQECKSLTGKKSNWIKKESWVWCAEDFPDSYDISVVKYVIKNYDKIYAIWKEETLKRSL